MCTVRTLALRRTVGVAGAVLAIVLAFAPAAHGQQRKPTVWAVTIGVSTYETPVQTVTINSVEHRVDLRKGVVHAAKDACDVAATFKAQEGKLFGKVVIRTVTNEQATARGIQDAMTWLREQRIDPRDYVLVFVAGHGGGQLFSPFDDDLTRNDKAVPWTTFQTALTGLPGTRLLVLDTCHAANAAHGAPRAEGIIVLASCMSREASGENAHPLRNGHFTRALLEALSGKADADGNGEISLAEVYTYVSNRLQQLTGGRQNPTVDHPASIRLSLPLARTGTPAVTTTTPPAPVMATTTTPPRPDN